MADSTTTLDTISSSQSSKEVTANALFDAMSQNALFGRRATTTSGLTWGYYGGKYSKADGTISTIPNGTVALTASATNYVLETDGVVSKVTVAPTGWPAPLAGGATPLYEIICGASAVTSYTDYRAPLRGPTGPAGPTGDTGPAGPTGPSGSAPLTTKGDLLVFTTETTRLAVGTDDQVLTADAAEPSGVKWAAAAGYTPPVTTKGDIFVFGAAAARLAVGTNGQTLRADSAEATGLKWTDEPLDVYAFYPGVMSNAVVILRVPIGRAFTFPANFAGSVGKASVNATGATAIDVQKNGVSVGTITYGAGGSTATFATSGGTAVSFAAGDLLTINGPATADTTLADAGIVLLGTRA